MNKIRTPGREKKPGNYSASFKPATLCLYSNGLPWTGWKHFKFQYLFWFWGIIQEEHPLPLIRDTWQGTLLGDIMVEFQVLKMPSFVQNAVLRPMPHCSENWERSRRSRETGAQPPRFAAIRPRCNCRTWCGELYSVQAGYSIGVRSAQISISIFITYNRSKLYLGRNGYSITDYTLCTHNVIPPILRGKRYLVTL